MIWFGVMIAMNLQDLVPDTSLRLRAVLSSGCPRRPEVKTGDIYRGVLPFIGIQALGLLLVIVFPGTGHIADLICLLRRAAGLETSSDPGASLSIEGAVTSSW